MRGNGERVPDQLPAADNERLLGHVGQLELQPEVNDVHRVDARPRHRHHRRETAVHVQAGRAAPADGEGVEEERVDGEGESPRQEERPVPPLDPFAPRVENPAEWTRWVSGTVLLGAGLDGDEGRAGGSLPFGLVGGVAAGGVENGNAYSSAGVAFNGIAAAGNRAAFIVIINGVTAPALCV